MCVVLRMISIGGLGIVLAACGSTSGAGAAGESAAQVAQDAITAIDGATSVHMAGTVRSGRRQIAFDVTSVAPNGLEGTISVNGKGSVKLITTDGQTFYLAPDDEFLAGVAGGNQSAVQSLSGKCLVAPSSDPNFGSLASGFSKLTDFRQLFTTPLRTAANLTYHGVSTVDGRQAVQLVGGDGTVLAFAATGPTLPLEFQKPGDDGGTIDFDQWNAASTITAPDGCEDVSTVLQTLNLPTPSPS